MAHIIGPDVTVEAVDTPSDWLPVGAFARDAANAAADRGDLIVKIGPGLAAAAGTAQFAPALGEIQINSDVCLRGVRLADLDLTDRLTLLSHPAFVGALIHEAAHARHTNLLDLKAYVEAHEVSPRLVDVVMMLEEPRIEARTLRSAHRNPAAIPGEKSDWPLYFTTMALDIVLRDFRISEDRYGAGSQVALILARVDGGSFLPDAAEPFAEAIAKVLDEPTVTALRKIAKAHFALDDDDIPGMIESAQAWLDALGIDADDDEDNLAGESLTGKPEDGEGEGEGGEGEGEGEGKGGAGSSEAFKDLARKAQAAVDGAASDERREEREDRAAAQRREDAKRREEAEDARASAFHGYSDDPDRGDHPVTVRKPEADERRAATSLGSLLAKVSYRDRVVTRTRAHVPPGRLNARAAVANSEARPRGGALVEPFVGKRRRHVDETPLTVGFIQDVSGSMGSAEVPMASTSWVIGEAARKIDAHVAGVLMGTKATGVVRPGKHYESVRVYDACAGHECFRDAFLALDATINLMEGSGARILFIASDAHFVSGKHREYAVKTLPELKRRGVAVVWLDFTGSFQTNYGYGSVLNVRGKSPAQVATMCGNAALAEFRKVITND